MLRLNDRYCNQDLHHGSLHLESLRGLRRSIPTFPYTLLTPLMLFFCHLSPSRKTLGKKSTMPQNSDAVLAKGQV